MTLRVAAVEAESVPGDVDANVRTALRHLDGLDADLVVFPELFLTGYDPACWTPDNTVTADDPRLEPLKGDRTLLLGAAVGRNISLVMVTDEVTVPYAKQHLDDSEVPWFEPGTRGAVVDVNGHRVGLGICWDSNFPSHIAAARDAGAEVYVCPSAWPDDDRTPARIERYQARAREAGIPVLMAGLVGAGFSGGAWVFASAATRLRGSTDLLTIK